MASKPMLPAVAVLEIRKLKSKLPDDFVQLLAVETPPRIKTFLRVSGTMVNFTSVEEVERETHETFCHISTQTEMMYGSLSNRKWHPRYFTINGNEIWFGSWKSKNVFIRFIQTIKDWWNPEKVILKYISSHCG